MYDFPDGTGNVWTPFGYNAASSSFLIVGSTMQTSPRFQSTGVATLCESVN